MSTLRSLHSKIVLCKYLFIVSFSAGVLNET